MDENRRCLIPFSLILLVSDFERKTKYLSCATKNAKSAASEIRINRVPSAAYSMLAISR